MSRLDALSRFDILDSSPDPVFDQLTRLASAIFKTPMAYVSFIDSTRQWFKSKVGPTLSETPRKIALCAHSIRDEAVTVIFNAADDDRFRDNPLITGPTAIRCYASAPIIDRKGNGLGTICIADTKARNTFDEQQQRILATHATLATMALEATEAHQSRVELAAEEQDARSRYSLVTRATLDGEWDWDLEKQRVYYSPRWQYILGLEDKGVTDSPDHWRRRVNPDDLPQLQQELGRHLQGETSRFRSEHRILHGDGNWRWVVVRGLAQRAGGQSVTRMAGSLSMTLQKIRLATR